MLLHLSGVFSQAGWSLFPFSPSLYLWLRPLLLSLVRVGILRSSVERERERRSTWRADESVTRAHECRFISCFYILFSYVFLLHLNFAFFLVVPFIFAHTHKMQRQESTTDIWHTTMGVNNSKWFSDSLTDWGTTQFFPWPQSSLNIELPLVLSGCLPVFVNNKGPRHF